MWRRNKWLGVRSLYFAAAAAALFAAIFGGRTLWRAQAVLHEAGDRVAAESSLRFTARPIDPVSLIGLESVGAPAVFVDAQVFNGRLFIAGPVTIRPTWRCFASIGPTPRIYACDFSSGFRAPDV